VIKYTDGVYFYCSSWSDELPVFSIVLLTLVWHDWLDELLVIVPFIGFKDYEFMPFPSQIVLVFRLSASNLDIISFFNEISFLLEKN